MPTRPGLAVRPLSRSARVSSSASFRVPTVASAGLGAIIKPLTVSSETFSQINAASQAAEANKTRNLTLLYLAGGAVLFAGAAYWVMR